MDTDNTLVQVTPDDIAFVEQELAKSRKVFQLRELVEKLAFLKTAAQRTQDVKIYDPACVYDVGDSISKDYDERLTVSSKTVEHFKGTVVLKVVKKIVYKGFDCDMLEVDYTSGGTFRKYIDYMKKTKTQVLLPANCGGGNVPPKIMGKSDDPRLTELPMTDRDLKALERSLKSALSKSPAFFSWNEFWQLTASRPDIPEEKIKEMETRIQAGKLSAATGDLVKEFLGFEPSHDLYDIHCLALNHLLETKYKKEFLPVSPLAWGKWHLKSVLNALPEHLPLAAGEAALPEFEAVETAAAETFHEFPLKVYLTWREILSGGVRIPKTFNKELSHAREYIFTDADDNKSYTVYYYPQQGTFLGLKDFFAAHNIPQGTSITLERKSPAQFQFWLKKSKKKLSVAKLAYEPATDMFSDAGEAPTLALPNKIIYIERETLQKLLALAPLREGLNLRDLLVLVFKSFGLQSANHSLHYLRAFHLVDVLKKTSQEDVERTLLNTFEFTKSDKKKGIFYYQEAPPAKISIEEIPAELPAEEEGIAAGEIPVHELVEELGEELELEIAAAELEQKPKAEAFTPAAKKEKPHKKKKPKGEGEKAPRAGKSERRVIEERIEEEESELEALYAEKAVEEEDIEGAEAVAETVPAAAAPVKAQAVAKAEAEPAEEETGIEEEAPKAEEDKPAAGGLFGNLFAEKLKTALTKKRAEDAQKKDE